MHLAAIATTLALALSPTLVMAEPNGPSTDAAESVAPAPAAASAVLTLGDGLLGIVAGDVGTVVLGGLPVLALWGCTAADACTVESAGTLAGILAVLGGFFGNAAGVYAYGQWAGYDGSYGWSLLGSLGGMMLSGAIATAFHDAYNPVTIGLLLTLPSLGSVVGYEYSLPDPNPVPDRLSHALIGVDGDQVRLGAPVPTLAPDPSTGELWLMLPLASGRY